MSDTPPVAKEVCALCQVAKQYAIPLLIVAVMVGVYLWKKNNPTVESK